MGTGQGRQSRGHPAGSSTRCWHSIPARCSTTPTSASSSSGHFWRRSPASPKTLTSSATCLHHSTCATPGTFLRTRLAVSTGSSVLQSLSMLTAARAQPRCPAGTWSTHLLARIAPTAHDEDTPGINPDFGRLLRGTVHDPTARRMGGVAGSAGVFSTVRDLGLFAQALLDRLAGRPSRFPLTQSTLELMASPQQPGTPAANSKQRTTLPGKPALPPPTEPIPFSPRTIPAIPGQNLRGLGWDIDTALSRLARHDLSHRQLRPGRLHRNNAVDRPAPDTYAIVLANVIHQRGGPPVVTLSGEIATETARALGLYGN